MNLYLISQDENDDWDTYDNAVVAAMSEDEARTIHPNGDGTLLVGKMGTWCSSPDRVVVTLIGTAVDGTKAGTVICASFNAG